MPSIDALNLQGQVTAAQNLNTASATTQAEGKFMGHVVKVDVSPESLLADAAEELGFAVDKTKDYDVEERKQRDISSAGKHLQEIYRKLMHEVGKGEKTGTLIDNLKKSDSKKGMLQALNQAFSDKTDAWAALGEAIESFEKDPSISTEQRNNLKSLYEEYTKENQTEIRLGLHGALGGKDFPELGGLEETRGLYRQTVGEFSSVNEVFSEIKAKYGDKFNIAMDFLFSSISADIKSEIPSMGKAHLESVHAKLEQVRLTQSAYNMCNDMLVRWRDVHGVKDCPITPMALLEKIMNLRTKTFVNPVEITELCQSAKPSDLEHEVIFTQELLSMVRKFPVALFDDEQGRMTLFDSVQGAVDDVVEREDAYLASLEQ